jgi:hypothetical protein
MYSLAQAAFTWHGATHLKDTLNNNLDPHVQMSSEITGRPYQELFDLVKQKDAEAVGYRNLSKVFNFSAGSFCGPGTLLAAMDDKQRAALNELEPGMGEEQIVRRILDTWTNTWELRPFLEYSSRACRGGNKPTYTCPITGRQKALNTFCQLNNLRFQGLGADAAKEGLRLVTENCYTENKLLNIHGVKVSVFIHDELLCSGPPDTLDIWVPQVQRLMEQGAENVLVDMDMKTEAGVCGDRWTKYDTPLEEWLESNET